MLEQINYLELTHSLLEQENQQKKQLMEVPKKYSNEIHLKLSSML